MSKTARVRVTRLDWSDIPLRTLALRKATLKLTLGLGSGLAHRRGSRAIWAVGDRGPNLKVKLGMKLGLKPFRDPARFAAKAKIMPAPEIGPAIAELRIAGGAMHCRRTIALRNAAGRPISGLRLPSFGDGEMEPIFDLKGKALPPDPDGADPEAIVALARGGFWIAEEYGPSLLRVAADGRILKRLVPEATAGRFAGAGSPIFDVLPARAAGRLLNRGFEALTLSADEAFLHAAFQSPLDRDATPDHRTVPVWKLDARTGAFIGEHRYRLDAPKSFRRDRAAGEIGWGDLKLGDACALDETRLLVLERVTQSAKIYAVDIRQPRLKKRLLFSTDDHPEIPQDLEGLAVLSDTQVLIVTDNDFGVEGAQTSFWQLDFLDPIASA